jgi:hypothetical protein
MASFSRLRLVLLRARRLPEFPPVDLVESLLTLSQSITLTFSPNHACVDLPRRITSSRAHAHIPRLRMTRLNRRTLETSGRTKFVPVPLSHVKSAIPHVGAEAVRCEVPSFCTSFPVKPFGGRPQRLNEEYISAVNVSPVGPTSEVVSIHGIDLLVLSSSPQAVMP